VKPLHTDSQCAQILGYLALGRRITPLTALDRFDCLRLGGRIHELRRRGHKIKREMILLTNGKRVAQYFLPRRSQA
jgi:hypothetical protein